MGCKGCCRKIPRRYFIMLMIFYSAYINYTTRSNISISLPAMIETRSKGFIAECIKEQEAPSSTGNSTSNSTTAPPPDDEDTGEKYDWNQTVQGFIHAAYFYGYLIGSLPGGAIVEFLGPCWTIFMSTAVSGALNSLCVWVIPIHWGALFAARFFIGLFGAFVYPGLQCLIGRWAPPQERTKFVSCLMGGTLGTCVTWVVGGAVIKYYKWPWSFHVMTLQIIVFLVVFSLLTFDSPEHHKWITEEELNFIKEAQGGGVTTSKKKTMPPYKAILSSFPFWTLGILYFGNLWGLYVQISAVPKFMKEFIGFDIKNSGILSSLPHLLRIFMGLGYGVLSDWLKKKKFRRVIILKSFILLSHLIPGVFMGLMSVAGCQVSIAVSFLVLSMAINGACVVTHLSNPTDLAPNFAGTIFGLISAIAGTSGFIVPSVTGAIITEYGNNRKAWSSIFALGGIVYCGSGIFFIIFGTAEMQPWNEKKDDEEGT